MCILADICNHAFLCLTFVNQVNSSGVMPIIFSTSSLALPGTLARFTGLAALKKAAVTLNPGGKRFIFIIFTGGRYCTMNLYKKKVWTVALI